MKLFSEIINKKDSDISVSIDINNQSILINGNTLHLFSPIVVQLSCSIKDTTYRIPSIEYNLLNITTNGFECKSHNIKNDNKENNDERNVYQNETEIFTKPKSMYDICYSMKLPLSTSDRNEVSKNENKIKIVEITNGRYLTQKMKQYCIMY